MNGALPPASRPLQARVISIGAMAADDLARVGTWRLTAVYERCFYCADGQGNLICIGQESIGRGPFTLLCSEQAGWPHPELLTVGRRLCIEPDRPALTAGGFRLDLSRALLWQERLDAIAGCGTCGAALAWLAERAGDGSPAGSLGRLIPWLVFNARFEPPVAPDLVMQALQGRIAELARQATRSGRLPSEGLVSLIGCGCGLTPAGDDFLAGYLLGLRLLGQHGEAQLLAEQFYRQARERTTEISIAFYRALAAGWLSEMHRQALALFYGTGNATELRQVTRFGATSGWDLLTGMVFVVSLVPACAARPDSADHCAAASH